MRADDEVLALLAERKTAQAGAMARMKDVASIVNGEKDVPLPELHRNEKPAVPNLVGQGLDQISMRIASTQAQAKFYPLTPGKPQSERDARTRRQVVKGWWEANDMQLKVRQRARHLVGWGSSPVIVRYDRKRDVPVWRLRSPMECFPSPSSDTEGITPCDVVFAYRKSLRWLQYTYPTQVVGLDVRDAKPDTLFELVHYLDEDVEKLIVVGKTPAWEGMRDNSFRLLEEEANQIGMCPVVIPSRLALDRSGGAYDTVLGMYERQARLMALEEIAIERGIFPEPWLDPIDPNIVPSVVTEADGREGIVGVVKGGRMNWEKVDPSFAALQAIDRYERAIRVTAGVPSDWGGESNNNIRTGRRGDSIVSSTVDYHIQEAQELLQKSLREEDRRAIALDKVHGGDRQKTIRIGWDNVKSAKTYTPSALWASDDHQVKYAVAGADADRMNIIVAQKQGTGEMSLETIRELDPLVEDPDLEKQRVIADRLDNAGLSAIEQQAAAGTIPISDLAAITAAVRAGDDWHEAVMKVQQAAQERQAPDVNPVPPGSPAAQPGLAMPGAGAEAGVSLPAQPPSLENLSSLLSNTMRVSRAARAA